MKNTNVNLIKITNMLFILFLISHFSLLTSKVEASALSLNIDPSIITINAIPPSTVTNNFTIQNSSDTQVTLQIQLRPFKALLENGELEYLSSQDPFIASNIQILDSGTPVQAITLGPLQEKNLTLSANIPIDTTMRDYYFSIILVSENNATSESNTSFNQLGIASNVLLSVGPKEKPKATLEEFSTKLFFEKGPVPFTVRIKNKGAHLIKPKGKITIENMFGQSIGNLDLESVNILSDSTRAIPNDSYLQELRLQDNLDAKSKSELNFKNPKALWKESFLLGIYTATLNVSLSEDGPIFVKSIRFFAFPFQGILVILTVIIVSILIKNRVIIHLKK